MKYLPLSADRLGDLCHLWNKEIGDQFPMREALFYQNSFDDQNVLPSGSLMVIDEQSNQVIGIIVSKLWQEKIEGVVYGDKVGWIQVLLVKSEYRNQEIGSTLLSKAEVALKENGTQKIILGRDPHHYFPGIPVDYTKVNQWFKTKGYVNVADDHDLVLQDQLNQHPLKLPQFKGVEFRLLHDDEGEKLISFLHRCFPGRWEYEAIYYVQRGGTGREFVVLEKEGQIIGFCRINDSKSSYIAQNVYWTPLFKEELGGIGPLGVDPKYRKKGYGLAIVQAGMYFLQQREIRNIVIDWTGLIELYQKLGFKVWKSYSHFKKDL